MIHNQWVFTCKKLNITKFSQKSSHEAQITVFILAKKGNVPLNLFLHLILCTCDLYTLSLYSCFVKFKNNSEFTYGLNYTVTLIYFFQTSWCNKSSIQRSDTLFYCWKDRAEVSGCQWSDKTSYLVSQISSRESTTYSDFFPRLMYWKNPPIL